MTSDGKRNAWSSSPFISDYGMVFVLLLLCVLFSVLTLKEQHPTGAAAGAQVADMILADNVVPAAGMTALR